MGGFVYIWYDLTRKKVHEPHSNKAKIKMSLVASGKKQKLVVCPHCNKEGGAATMPRWHFDNCKTNLGK